MSGKSKCPQCGAVSLRQGALKCPACRVWVRTPALAKSRAHLGPLRLVLLAAGLGAAGAIAGVATVLAAQGGIVSPPTSSRPGSAAPTAVASALASASATATASAPATVPASTAAPATAPAPAADAGPARPWTVGAQIPLEAAPIDVLLSDDEKLVFVLCEDGSLRAHALEGGAEKARARLPGKGTALRRLAGGRLAVLGVAASLPVVQLEPWLGAQPEKAYLTRVDVLRAVDVVALGEPPALFVATSQGNRVLRLAAPSWRPDGNFVVPGTVRALAALHADKAERLVVLGDGRLASEPGVVVTFDPFARPFGGTRAAWASVTEPRASSRSGGAHLLLFDRGAAGVLDLPLDGGPRLAPAGPQPLAAFAWPGERAVAIGAAGEATVTSIERREVLGTVPLGGLPSAAAATPDGKSILVALGGGPRGRGAMTAVLGGEPPRVEATLKTGEGAGAVAVGASGRVGVVTAYWARSLAVLGRP